MENREPIIQTLPAGLKADPLVISLQMLSETLDGRMERKDARVTEQMRGWMGRWKEGGTYSFIHQILRIHQLIC